MNSSQRALLSLSWQSVAYGVGVFGSQAIIYLMLPILTRYMPEAEYGAVAVIMTLYTFLNTLTNAGLPAATFRIYSEPADGQTRRLVLGSSQFLFFLFAAVPAAGILAFSQPISTFMLGSDRYANALQLAAAFLVVDSMNLFGTVILRIQVRPLVASIQSIILITCETGMAILFVTVYHMGVTGYWLGYLTGELVGLMFTIWFVRRSIVFRISWDKIVQLTNFGVPLIPTALSIIALRVADRYIIGSLAGLEQAAVYDVGYKLGSIVSLLIAPFRIAWTPFALSMGEKPEAPRIYRDVLTYVSAGCAFLILGVIAFQTELLHFMAPASYSGAATVVSWVAASQLLYAAYIVLAVGPMVAKRTQLLLWATVPSATLNLVLNFILIPAIGILGAAIATFAAYLVLAVLTYIVGRRAFVHPIDWMRLAKLTLVTGLVAATIVIAKDLSVTIWAQRAVKIVGLCLFPILLLLIGFVKPAQAQALFDAGRTMIFRRFIASKE